jgi:hypothetical protein
MEIKEVLEELSSLTKKINTPTPTNPATIQGHKARKKSAELRIPDVKKEYRRLLVQHIVPIVVTGSTSKDFFDTAVDKIKILGIDGESIYKDLLSLMPKEASSGKMTSKVVVDVLSRHFEDLAAKSGVVSYPQILYKNSKGFAIKDQKDLMRLIKQSINDVGSEMSLIYNLDKISEYALEMGFDGSKPFLPVLVLVEDQGIVSSILEGQKRLFGSSYLLTSGEASDSLNKEAMASVSSTTKDSVSKALKSVKDDLVKRSKK